MGSALLNTPPIDQADCEAAAHSHAASATHPEALRLQVAERLAEHRNRRNQLRPQPQTPQPAAAAPSPAAIRAARIAASVAERFAHSLSYRAFLAAEAERATQQAQAAAEVAALNAQAVAQAEQQLLEALYPDAADELNPATDSAAPSAPPATRAAAPSRKARTNPLASKTVPAPVSSGLTVCLFEDAALSRPATQPATLTPNYGTRKHDHDDGAEARALDDEITFRHAPVFEEPAGPPVPLPANLIEFPRQLIAPRKVRPRYAEGPLREDDAPAPGGAQLRIFEVDPDQISTTPDVVETPTPQWTSLWLDTVNAANVEVVGSGSAAAAALPAHYAVVAPCRYPAPVRSRIQAAAFDAAIIFAGFVASAATFAMITFHAAPAGTRVPLFLARTSAVLTGHAGIQPGLAVAVAACALVFLYLLYQVLFFSLSEATPGMRRARIALCTFADENPTRRAMRRRILAVLLSACSLGLGFLWAALDEDRLAWHDLISRMYQRSY
jgi:uncharacterized RDD family membrane protein YckC